MFSKRTLLVVGLIALIALNIILITLSNRRPFPSSGPGHFTLYLVAPFQEGVTQSVRFFRGVWYHYFYLVSAAKEKEQLSRALKKAEAANFEYQEVFLTNKRLRAFLNFQKDHAKPVVAAEVIAKDPSPWSQTILIDKGTHNQIRKGMSVVVPEGIVGQVIDTSAYYATVLLVVDQNNKVDALVQRTRARGIVKGSIAQGECSFEYFLRKDDVEIGDTIISSGLDGVYPKGLPIGNVTSVIRRSSGIHQEVTIIPFVDFEKIEEVIVILQETEMDGEIHQ
jgi:rod shape-determining protein MreC